MPMPPIFGARNYFTERRGICPYVFGKHAGDAGHSLQPAGAGRHRGLSGVVGRPAHRRWLSSPAGDVLEPRDPPNTIVGRLCATVFMALNHVVLSPHVFCISKGLAQPERLTNPFNPAGAPTTSGWWNQIAATGLVQGVD